MRLRSDLTLLLVAVIWGGSFAVQRVTAPQVGIFLFTGLRFLLAALALLPFALRRGRPTREGLRWIVLAGCILFAASTLQQAGLRWTSAGNAGFITTLYVVLVPVILVLFFRQRLGWVTWAAALTALVGLWLLSSGGTLRLAPGDGLELAGAVFWALHVVVLSKAVHRMDALQLAAGQFLVNGALNMLPGLALERGTLAALSLAWWAVVYAGLISVAVGYTLQVVAQKHAPPADAALILSMEAVFAALSGYIFLSEQLSGVQLAGCALILGAGLSVQVWNRQNGSVLQ